MKRLLLLSLLVIISLVMFTGCSLFTEDRVSSSTMLRTVGIGESAMPIEAGSFAIEFFNDEATTVDAITETSLYSGNIFEPNDYYVSGGVVSKDCRYYGVNSRFGVANHTEGKIGFFGGSIENGYSSYDYYDENGQTNTNKMDFYTSIAGFQLGLKRLLTDYNNPHRLSLYVDGKYFTTSSENPSDKYDGENIEVKSAIIYGYLPNPALRNFPSLALYYSLSNTKRLETIPGVPLKKQPQAVGIEANYSLDMGPLYSIFSLGIEKEIADKASDDLNPYFGFKLGLHFNQLKSR